MYPLTLTLAFLALLGILTSGDVKRTVDDSFQMQIFVGASNTKQTLQSAYVSALFEDIKGATTEKLSQKDKKEPSPQWTPPKENKDPQPTELREKKDPPPIPLKINLCRPPNHSRLNFALLLNRQEPPNRPSHLTQYEIAASLMRNLYKNEPFFNQIPDCEYKILDELISKKELTQNFIYPDDLCGLIFDREELQRAFYTMCKGGKGLYPSFLHYITFDRENLSVYEKRINLLYAPKEILGAIFPEANLLNDLLQIRQGLWEEILHQEEHRNQLNKETALSRTKIRRRLERDLQELLIQSNLPPKIYIPLFNCRLGTPGNILLVQDHTTGITIRQKI